MSRWWRTCQNCGESGDDVRQCQSCHAFTPFGSQREPNDDWKLALGTVVIAFLAVVVILALGLLAIYGVGGP